MGLRAFAMGIVVLFGLLGCAGRTSYPCATSEQCVAGGKQGVCGEGGYCAFADTTCESGQRYEPNAGGGLAGECTSPGDAACGTEGGTCCETGDACVAGASCNAGTCERCIEQIVMGRRFSCTLHADGTVWCAGENNRGQLGNGLSGNIPSAEPVQVRDLTSAFITDAIALGAGRDFACAIRADKTVWCWGANDDGQLGIGDLDDRALAEQVITTANAPLGDIVSVAGGEDFACARTASGGIFCWGENEANQIGDGTVVERPKAVPVLIAVGGAPLTGTRDLAVGGAHACVHKDGDEIYCWGGNGNGQLGNNTEVNQPVPLLVFTASELALGRWHTCAVKSDTSIACWGLNDHARLGLGYGQSFSGEDVLVPTTVLQAPLGLPFMGAKSLAAGGVTCALMQNASVYCWSDSPYGQTGTGAGATVPVAVTLADGTPLTGVAELVADHTHVCARRTSGELLCWGRNLDGDFGDGTFT
ncbi:MAG TPA: hypothetical protein VIU61_16580, partial [Kofleriaceae bacterium]